jgi:hypothetical protein
MPMVGTVRDLHQTSCHQGPAYECLTNCVFELTLDCNTVYTSYYTGDYIRSLGEGACIPLVGFVVLCFRYLRDS